MAPGVYTLVLGILQYLSINTGSLGMLGFPTGLYVYTGSALGAGGLDTRISRHLRREKKAFWHIDHLTSERRINILAFIKAEAQHKVECKVNKTILSRFGATPIPRFGSSDCRASCRGHLLDVGDKSLSACLEGIGEVYVKAELNPVDTIL